MVEYLSHRPLSAATPETMGLFASYYDDLQPALTSKLPDAVEVFNGKLSPEIRFLKGLARLNAVIPGLYCSSE